MSNQAARWIAAAIVLAAVIIVIGLTYLRPIHETPAVKVVHPVQKEGWNTGESPGWNR